MTTPGNAVIPTILLVLATTTIAAADAQPVTERSHPPTDGVLVEPGRNTGSTSEAPLDEQCTWFVPRLCGTVHSCDVVRDGCGGNRGLASGLCSSSEVEYFEYPYCCGVCVPRSCLVIFGCSEIDLEWD